MKSVGEVMAIGRTFHESLQKALRSMEIGLSGLDDFVLEGLGKGDDKNVIREALGTPSPDRILKVAQALRMGVDHEQIHTLCIDPWFISRLQEIVDMEGKVRTHGLPETKRAFRDLKSMGFSDTRLAALAESHGSGVLPKSAGALAFGPYTSASTPVRRSFSSPTAYMYSTYENPLAGREVCEAHPTGREKVIILGSGPNRIGQGIEFDYCCCHAAFSLSKAGYETIMINCNLETVSTDYDTSDRLYFEPLTPEDVLAVVKRLQTES